jgi:hypothetical protein
MKVLFIPVTGDIEVRDIEGLEGMQALVGGMIECVGIREDLELYCNENGWAENLELNRRATNWINTIQDGIYYLKGDVFLTGGVDDEGETLPITDQNVYIVEGCVKALAHVIY